MKLITEVSEAVKCVIEEGAGSSPKKYFIEGTFAVANQKNQNGRIYPLETLMGACKKFQSVIEANRGYGELGHPQGPGINLDKVSHMIKEMRHTGDGIFRGRAQVLDTPNGMIVQKLLDAGANLGVSTRGMGSLVTVEGYQEVQPDFHLATVDIVADPSAPGAYVEGIMEGREWMLIDGTFKEVDMMNARKIINEASRKKETEKIAMRMFENYIRKL